MNNGTPAPDTSTPTPSAEPLAVRLYRNVEPHFTQLRLEAYSRDPQHPDPERVVLARYLLNLALCEALYPALHMLEVVLRNAVCRAATVRWPGSGALDPTTGRLDCWLDWEPARSPLLEVHQRMVDGAKVELTKLGYPLTEGRLIAALPFGFWTGMFSSPYGDPMPSQPRLWPSLFTLAFPHAPAGGLRRSSLADELRQIRLLRNRVFHHEPIWRRKVRRDEDAICALIGRSSSTAAQMVRETSRLEAVVRASLAPHEQIVKRLAEQLS